MKCKYCKTEIEEGVLVCPNCGAPAPVDKDYQEEWDEMMGYERDEDLEVAIHLQASDLQETVKIEPTKTKMSAKTISKLSLWSFICSVMIVLAPIGFILGIIDLFIKDGKNKTMSIIAIAVAVFDVLYVGFFAYMFNWFAWFA